ncbi:hypothetical protein [Methylobacterium sp. SyP6R]|uniref:hypothetical protein n=1 Tax=Methylobacterium sp. SyP6R TaxID=2718876 RepID=UPI001F45448B|nr:hypothetical protein [Methylobacterium sp. SyP6R]MCF4130256.1 hypothetical protein [Methylobacterium sp. SyP6R]
MTHAVPPGALAEFSREAEPAGPSSPPTCRVTVHLDGREFLAFDGVQATISHVSFGQHERLVAALISALELANNHRPVPSDLVEGLRLVELLAKDRDPLTVQMELGFIRSAIDDAQRTLAAEEPAPTRLN